jgi:hypothetical protein
MVGEHRNPDITYEIFRKAMSDQQFHSILRKLPRYTGKVVCNHARTIVVDDATICDDQCGIYLGPAIE